MKDQVHPRRVLFVCLGNICRSPTAEAVCRTMAQDRGIPLVVDSAGTGGYHIGSPPDPRSAAAAARRGYSFDGIRARQVSARDFAQFDYVLAMDRSNLRALELLCPAEYRHKLDLLLAHGREAVEEVPDPYYGGPKGFERVLDLIEDGCHGLLARIEREGNAA